MRGKWIVFVMVFFQSWAWAEFQAAYVDMQKIIQSTSAGKKAKKRLEKEFNKKKKQLSKKEKELQKQAAAFEKKRMILSEKVRGQKQAELQKKMVEFQQELQQSQINIQKKERELTTPIVKKVQKVIEKIAKKKNYSMVFERNIQGIVWSRKNLDITQEVITEFEKSK